MDSFRILLIPLSVFFYIIIFLRNFLYNSRIFKSVKINIPVISVGNISTGGTGKTPFIIFLARFYLKIGKNVGIISRGYRRKTKNLVLVSNGDKIDISPEDSGDEVYMIASNLIKDFNNFFIVSSSNRTEASKYILDNFKCDIILLDDAFQHRNINRNIDIVVIDVKKSNNFFSNILLPAGYLREPFSALKRSSMIILNHKFTKKHKSRINFNKFNKPIVNVNYETKDIYNYRGDVLKVIEQRAILFCGIAEPESFVYAVGNEGIKIDKVFTFSDHYIYSEMDINYFKKYNKNEIILITTEKDFVKLTKYRDFIENFPIYYLRININFADNIKLLEKELNSILY